MAKKMTGKLGVEFGNISLGKNDISRVGIKMKLEDQNLDANSLVALLAGAQLSCRLSRGTASQQTLPGVVADLEVSATCKCVRIGSKEAGFGLSFASTSMDANKLHRFAGQAGTLYVTRVGDSEENIEPADDDDAGDAKAEQDAE